MFEYRFVTIKLTSFRGKPKDDYHKVIEENARNGWRLVQIFAPVAAGLGFPTSYELIFEKQLPI